MVNKTAGATPFYEVVGSVKDPATKKYIKEKLKTLEELGYHLSEEQIEHIWTLKTELEVDRYARDVIMGGWQLKRLGLD